MSCNICEDLQETCQGCLEPKRYCRSCGKETPKHLYYRCNDCQLQWLKLPYVQNALTSDCEYETVRTGNRYVKAINRAFKRP